MRVFAPIAKIWGGHNEDKQTLISPIKSLTFTGFIFFESPKKINPLKLGIAQH